METIQKVDMRPVLQLAVLADYIIPFAIRVVADLGVADLLKEGAKHIDDIASETKTHPVALGRVLRALVSRNVFAEPKIDYFVLTPMAEVLCSDHPYSLRDGFPLFTADIKAWSEFDYSIRTNKPSFDKVHGMSYWEYLAKDKDYSLKFDKAMACYSRIELRAVLPVYDWEKVDTVVDIGGGNGRFLSGLLSYNPKMKGILFDQNHVIVNARDVISEAGVADRCEVIGGSAFDGVPAGHTVYTMKRVLYDFNDEEAVRLLKSIRKAMRADSRLLLIDPVVETYGAHEYALSVDLLMLAMVTGYTRSRDQVEELFNKAGLKLNKFLPTTNFPVIEAIAA